MIQDKNLLGESPIWNYFDSSLYWVDIDGYKVKKYNDEKGIISYHMKYTQYMTQPLDYAREDLLCR